MSTRRRIKYVHEGHYVAEVEVELIDDGSAWAPYLSLDDAEKLEGVRAALARGNVTAASRQARVFTLHSVAASR
jgi:hypothetical protein